MRKRAESVSKALKALTSPRNPPAPTPHPSSSSSDGDSFLSPPPSSFSSSSLSLSHSTADSSSNPEKPNLHSSTSPSSSLASSSHSISPRSDSHSPTEMVSSTSSTSSSASASAASSSSASSSSSPLLKGKCPGCSATVGYHVDEASTTTNSSASSTSSSSDSPKVFVSCWKCGHLCTFYPSSPAVDLTSTNTNTEISSNGIPLLNTSSKSGSRAQLKKSQRFRVPSVSVSPNSSPTPSPVISRRSGSELPPSSLSRSSETDGGDKRTDMNGNNGKPSNQGQAPSESGGPSNQTDNQQQQNTVLHSIMSSTPLPASSISGSYSPTLSARNRNREKEPSPEKEEENRGMEALRKTKSFFSSAMGSLSTNIANLGTLVKPDIFSSSGTSSSHFFPLSPRGGNNTNNGNANTASAASTPGNSSLNPPSDSNISLSLNSNSASSLQGSSENNSNNNNTNNSGGGAVPMALQSFGAASKRFAQDAMDELRLNKERIAAMKDAFSNRKKEKQFSENSTERLQRSGTTSRRSRRRTSTSATSADDSSDSSNSGSSSSTTPLKASTRKARMGAVGGAAASSDGIDDANGNQSSPSFNSPGMNMNESQVRRRRYGNLKAYSPDNLDYLKAQTALLALQSQKKPSTDPSSNKSASSSGKNAASNPRALKVAPDRYAELIKRRKVPGTDPNSTSPEGSTKNGSNANNLSPRSDGEGDEGASPPKMAGSSIAPIKGSGRNRFKNSAARLELLSAQEALLKLSTKKVSEAMGSGSGAEQSSSLAGLSQFQAEIEAMKQTVQENAKIEESVKKNSISTHLRQAPNRYQHLLKKRQETIANLMDHESGLIKRNDNNLRLGKDLSVDQYKKMKSLEEYFQTLSGAQKGGARRGSEIMIQKDADGDTPLHQASFLGQVSIADYLLSKGADINVRNEFDETPIYLASKNGEFEMVQLLAKKGADCTLVAHDGNNAIDIAATDQIKDWLVMFSRKKKHFMEKSNASSSALKDSLAMSSAAAAGGMDRSTGLDGNLGSRPGKPSGLGLPFSASGIQPSSSSLPTSASVGLDKRDRIGDSGQTWSAGSLSSSLSGRSMDSSGISSTEGGTSAGVDDEALEDLSEGELGEELIEAAANGDLEDVRRLLSMGAPPNFVDEEDSKWSPLHFAAYNGHAPMVELLLAKGANVDQRDEDDCTPLHWAACQSHLAVVKILVQHDADVNALNLFKSTPVLMAARNKQLALVQHLIVCGNAKGNIPDDDGDTALHAAAASDSLEMVILLVEHGSDPAAKGKSGETPLHTAVSVGQLAVCKYLVEVGGKDLVNRTDVDKETPLHWACRSTERTGLIDAVSVAVARFLLENGANPNAQNTEGDTPVHVAAKEGSMSLVKLFCDSAAAGDKQAVDLKSANEFGWTSLHTAAFAGRLEAVTLLVETGKADLGALSTDPSGCTPLHLACYEDHLPVVEYLYKAGSDVRWLLLWAQGVPGTLVGKWVQDNQSSITAKVQQQMQQHQMASQNVNSVNSNKSSTSNLAVPGMEGSGSGSLPLISPRVGGSGAAVKAETIFEKASSELRNMNKDILLKAERMLKDQTRFTRDMTIALTTLCMVIVSICWKYSYILAIFVAVLSVIFLGAKRAYDTL